MAYLSTYNLVNKEKHDVGWVSELLLAILLNETHFVEFLSAISIF